MNDTIEMILVPRAEFLAWAKAWQDDYGCPNDGTDCVTPFDTYLMKAPVAPVGVEGLPERWRREAPQAGVDSGEDAACAYREAVYWCAFQLEAALAQQPAAPVGVEELAKGVAEWVIASLGDLTDDYENMSTRDVVLALLDNREHAPALARQPAAAGEEIMVNAAHDVYTLPLQPSGLSSGPRFVVHVPAPDLNAWRAAFIAERANRYRDGGMKIEQARIHAETDAARMAVLAAAQQQGGTQPVAWQFQDRKGNWHEFTDEEHRLNTIEDGRWPIRALYAHPPPSAPVGVPEGWPKANEEDASRGWTIDYGFLDRVTDIAKSRTYYTTSAEASEQVLIAALEVLATTPRSKRHDR